MATAELAPKSAVSRSRRMRRLRENATGYLFIAPWIIGLVVFTGGPIFGGLALSLFDWDTLSAPEFIGFDNFTRLPTDERFVTLAASDGLLHVCERAPRSHHLVLSGAAR